MQTGCRNESVRRAGHSNLCPEHDRELEELGRQIERRCTIVQTLTVSMQWGEPAGRSDIRRKMETQNAILFRLLERESDLLKESPAPVDQVASAHIRLGNMGAHILFGNMIRAIVGQKHLAPTEQCRNEDEDQSGTMKPCSDQSGTYRSRHYRAGFPKASCFDSVHYAKSEAEAFAKANQCEVLVYSVDVTEEFIPLPKEELKGA